MEGRPFIERVGETNNPFSDGLASRSDQRNIIREVGIIGYNQSTSEIDISDNADLFDLPIAACAWRPASKLSRQDILDRHVLKREVRAHPLEPHVLGLKFLDPLELSDRHPLVLAAPPVVSKTADPMLAPDLPNGQSRVAFGQDRNDLALRELRPPHHPTR